MDKRFAVAAAAGTFKGVFTHGVLAAFESAQFLADAYACASSSVISSTLAAIGAARSVGIAYWQDAATIARAADQNMSHVVMHSIRRYGPLVKSELFPSRPTRIRVLVFVSAVNNDDAAAVTQGDGAGRLGRRLLIDALKGDNTWAERNLDKVYFDSQATEFGRPLTPNNFDAVVYASTRMLHAWKQPAWVEGKPYIDASYTCMCPAYELCAMGYREVLAIGTEPGTLFTDIFRRRAIEGGMIGTAKLSIIVPDYDLKTVGVDFTCATDDGLKEAYHHGYQKGLAFLAS
ncbi:hypothetical protein HF925_05035 [Acidithiobacillus ferriphilus]|uniref:hypothetical protein n=1 Tax=Acidithiobacillus ferriphilus TaxID=1689834 RepID=UPI001C066DB9|nr:hypothetical protein [Acidithiobacillus ferriphilus]MBU2847956.1 hypothetical protein [Acidithiobacillus ferriphilus]